MEDTTKSGHTISVCVDEETFNALMSGNKLVPQVTPAPSTSRDEGIFKWTSSLISMLIDIRLDREAEFNRPLCKKKQLWNNIAQEINKANNISSLTGEACDNKFRNLMGTYRANKKKESTYGGAITWEYFDIFDNVFGPRMSDPLPTSGMPDNLGVVKREPYYTIAVRSSGNGKKKNSMTLDEYLFQKNVRDSQTATKKLKLQEQIWKEKKNLKEREIEAVLELSKAISCSQSNELDD